MMTWYNERINRTRWLYMDFNKINPTIVNFVKYALSLNEQQALDILNRPSTKFEHKSYSDAELTSNGVVLDERMRVSLLTLDIGTGKSDERIVTFSIDDKITEFFE